MALDPEPFAAMYAAVEAVGRGDAGEIEMEWTTDNHMGNESRLTITVRREVKHFTMATDAGDDQ